MRKSLRSSSSRTASRLSQLSTLIALLLLAQPALAQNAEGEEQARAHFRLGRAYYENGDFGKAATEFESAFRISQRPGLLYNIYLAYRDASDVPHAAEALRKYLELEKTVENRGQLTARLAAMDRALAEEAAQAAEAAQAPAPTPAKSASPLAPAQAATAPQSSPGKAPAEPAEPIAAEASQPTAASEPMPPAGAASSSSRADVEGSDRLWPIVLMAGGGVLVATSVITGVLALGKRGDLSSAHDECTSQGNCSSLPADRLRQLEDTRKSGTMLATMTDVLLFGGIAVAAAGATWFVLTPSREKIAVEASPQASFACIPGNCAARLSVHF